MTAASKLTALSAFLALLLLRAADARAEMHTLYFTFNNQRPSNETISAFITNQNRFTTITNGTSSDITSPFETSGQQWSTGYYDVRVTKEGQQTNVYCSYQAVAEYRGANGWYCTVTLNTRENGATTCEGRTTSASNRYQACTFAFDTR